jgi:hypothetical protein
METTDNKSKSEVTINHNKQQRLKLIEGLTKYLDSPEDVNAYLSSAFSLSSIANIENKLVQFKDRDGNIIDTDFSASIEKYDDKYAILPSPSNDRDQCQKLLDELTAKIDTHQLVIDIELSGESSDPYDPHTDDNF